MTSARRIITQNICLGTAAYVCVIGFFIYHFHFTEKLLYGADVCCLFLVLLDLKAVIRGICHKRLRIFGFLIVFLLITATLYSLFNGFSFLRWLWSLRNWGRLFLYFYLFAGIITREYAARFLKLTLVFFVINCITVVVEYCILRQDIPADARNGLMGRNTSTGHMIMAVMSIVVVCALYLGRQAGFRWLIVIYASAFIVAAIAELRALMIFSIAIFVILYFAYYGLKKVPHIILFLIISVAVICASFMVMSLFHPWTAQYVSPERLINAVMSKSGYFGQGKIDRLTAVSVINNRVFDHDGILRKLFGIGMGNGEYSSFSFLCSPFWYEHGTDLGYLAFSVATIYLESGYVGLSLYVLAMMYLVYDCWRHLVQLIRTGEQGAEYELVGVGSALMSVVFIWYNNLHRTDMSIILAAYMAIPYVASRNSEKTI